MTKVLILAAMAMTTAVSTFAFAFQGRMIEFKSGPEGFETSTYFYESESTVVAFNAQFTSELARKAIDYLRTQTAKPISSLVILQPNPVQFNGAQVFKNEGAQIIASEATMKAIPDVQKAMGQVFSMVEFLQPVIADQTFPEQMDIILLGHDFIQLKEFVSSGASHAQTVASIPSINSLIVGNLIDDSTPTWIAETPPCKEWILDLQMLETHPAQTQVYGGRGLAGSLEIALKRQIKLVHRLFAKDQSTN